MPELQGNLRENFNLPPGDTEIVRPDALWPGEAWKVRAEVVVARFSPDQVLSLPRISLPLAHGRHSASIPAGAHAVTRKGDVQVRLLRVAQHAAWDATMDVEISGLQGNQRLTVVGPDGKGQFWSDFSGLRNGRQTVTLSLASDERTYDLSFAMQEAHSVEFTVQPSIGPGS